MTTKELIIADLSNFIEENGYGNSGSRLYVGITGDIERRLFQQHCVDRDSNDWAYAKCSTSNIAREIEEFLILKYNTKGDRGGGDENSDHIYVYRMNGSTNP